MSNRVVEYVIRAKNAVGAGVQAAVAEMKKVETASRSGAGAVRDFGGGADAGASKTEKLSRSLYSVTHAGMAVGQMLRGNVSQGLLQLSRTIEGVVPNIGLLATNVMAVVGAFASGYQIGTMIDQLTGASDKLAKMMTGDLVKALEVTKEQMDKINATSFARLRAEFGTVIKEAARTREIANRFAENSITERGLRAELMVSEIERTEPESKERDAKIADIRRRASQGDALDKKASLEATLSTAQTEAAAASARLKELHLKRQRLLVNMYNYGERAKETKSESDTAAFVGARMQVRAFDAKYNVWKPELQARKESAENTIAATTHALKMIPLRMALNESGYLRRLQEIDPTTSAAAAAAQDKELRDRWENRNLTDEEWAKRKSLWITDGTQAGQIAAIQGLGDLRAGGEGGRAVLDEIAANTRELSDKLEKLMMMK